MGSWLRLAPHLSFRPGLTRGHDRWQFSDIRAAPAPFAVLDMAYEYCPLLMRRTAPLLVLCCAGSIDAQVLRGTARIQGSDRPIENGRVVALLADGRGVGATTTDDRGRFYLRVASNGAPFVVAVTRLGMRPTTSNSIMAGDRDTLDVDFSVHEEGVVTDTMKVVAAPGLNEIRLQEAQRRGWNVFPPTEIAEIRERVNSFEDLLRSTGYTGLIISPRRDDCIRSTRLNRCLTVVVDGIPLSGGNPLINPRDVYFMAVLTPSQAQLQFGERAFYGALVVYTRAYGDKYDRERERH